MRARQRKSNNSNLTASYAASSQRGTHGLRQAASGAIQSLFIDAQEISQFNAGPVCMQNSVGVVELEKDDGVERRRHCQIRLHDFIGYTTSTSTPGMVARPTLFWPVRAEAIRWGVLGDLLTEPA